MHGAAFEVLQNQPPHKRKENEHLARALNCKLTPLHVLVLVHALTINACAKTGTCPSSCETNATVEKGFQQFSQFKHLQKPRLLKRRILEQNIKLNFK